MTTQKFLALNWANMQVIEVNNTSGAALSQPLPAAPTTGQVISVKDWGGNAGTYPITVLGNIDGVTNFVMNLNNQSITLYWDNIRWNLI